jgi:hypothetical protein
LTKDAKYATVKMVALAQVRRDPLPVFRERSNLCAAVAWQDTRLLFARYSCIQNKALISQGFSLDTRL